MRNESLVSLGRRIKSIRKDMGINQEEMAETLGISSGYMSEIERGNANPTADLLFKLGEKYHINISFLFYGTGETTSPLGPGDGSPEFDLDTIVDSKEKLSWLLDMSVFYRNTILGYASKILYENQNLIETEIKKSKRKG